MDKPDWKDAPRWAGWLAQDKDGQWGWYEVKPAPSPFADTWYWVAGEWEEAAIGEHNDRWNETLEPRP